MASPDPIRPNGGADANSGLGSLFRMLRILFFCFLTLIVAVFVYYFVFSGIFRVDEQNTAMRLRFGRLCLAADQTAELQSGKWYWSYPFPVDEVIMVPKNKSITVSTDNFFKPWTNPTGAEMDAGNRPLRPGVDGYVVSADKHIFHVEWSVSYRVRDAAKYYLDFYTDPESTAPVQPGRPAPRLRGHAQILRCLLADAVLTETAGWTTEELIKTVRTVTAANGQKETQRIEERVRSRLAELAEEAGIGIDIQAVSLRGSYQPPAAALAAFNQVNASERQKQTAIQNAQAFANSLKSQAEARREQIVTEAKAYHDNIVTRMQAQREYFEAIHAEYRKNPELVTTVLYTSTLRDIFARVPNKFVLHRNADGTRQQLRLQLSQIPEKNNAAAAPAAQPQ